MTEDEFQRLLADPTIAFCAQHHWDWMVDGNGDGRKAVDRWVAMEVISWLNAWRGRQYVMVNRVWSYFESGRGTDIDLTVHHGGRDEKFKLRVELAGQGAYLLRINKWVNGQPRVVWQRVGQGGTMSDGAYAVTSLPGNTRLGPEVDWSSQPHY
jgi:hypothetical protein